MDDAEFDLNKLPNKTYISSPMPNFGEALRKVRIASKAFGPTDEPSFATVKGELVIRQKKDAKRVIKATFFEDDRQVSVLNLQTYTVETGVAHKTSFALIGQEIANFLEFTKHIQEHIFKHDHPVNITDEELRRYILSEKQATQFMSDNPEVLAEVLRTRITKEDIVAVAYRREQLVTYGRLLNESGYFARAEAAKGRAGEALWQKFFEKNTWFFGYGLGYLFLSSLDDRKLETMVQGHSIVSHGKRADALMKTRGLISSLCFVEIKIHTTKLLAPKPYRAGCWAPSAELVGAVAQVQGTVQGAISQIGAKFIGKDESGAPTGEQAFNVQPRSFLVIGSLSEFMGEHGINEEQYRSFELYRRNTAWPEIITFDELYERASHIINHNTSQALTPSRS
ncbi:Shedu immune nuclease family protein [Pseudoduganella sp. R-32]|uniref:Shedu immune nuclease family protein n=1 Tax=Pseudoduganella sp. R-32 TaxID=3404061 RepID=UPI003CEEC089